MLIQNVEKAIYFIQNFIKIKILTCDSNNIFHTHVYKINNLTLGIGKENKNRNPCCSMEKEQ